ncbi:MAG: class I SAM-dependent methyltransferase [Nocardioidaceae bacterium]|nr:class I SAM-dependent methyltransferase [Nocardioidaceae bacterium]
MTQRQPARFRPVDDAEAQRANRGDWNREADEYQRAHGKFLGDASFIWSPEGVDEADVRLLGDIEGRRVLEIGCGAGQCARWLRAQGTEAVGIDLSHRQLQHSRRLDGETSLAVPVACATATALPFSDGSFDLACSAFGALPFIVDIRTALREVARVLRPAGRFVFSVVHPMRQVFPDDPSERGLWVSRSYFDDSAYVESDADGFATYVEPVHTLGEWVAAITAAGLRIDSLLEPRWPAGHTRVWGAWGPIRGAYLPGTAIFSASLCELGT